LKGNQAREDKTMTDPRYGIETNPQSRTWTAADYRDGRYIICYTRESAQQIIRDWKNGLNHTVRMNDGRISNESEYWPV
jgi:hypothetical protein